MRQVVDALGAAFASGDVACVLSHFAPGDDIAYAGSEPGEVALGREAVRALLVALFSRDERYGWRAHDVQVLALGERAYVVAEATLTVTPLDPRGEVEHAPYRLSGVLELDDGHWLWRTCQGAEPTSAPD